MSVKDVLLKECLWEVVAMPSSKSNSKIAVTWACALTGPYDRHNVTVKIIAEHMPRYSIRWYCEVPLEECLLQCGGDAA